MREREGGEEKGEGGGKKRGGIFKRVRFRISRYMHVAQRVY